MGNWGLLNSFEHNATVKCNRMKSQKIRRRPESCHAYHPHVSHHNHTVHERLRIYIYICTNDCFVVYLFLQENAKDCGGACGIAVSLTLYFICLGTSLALRWLIICPFAMTAVWQWAKWPQNSTLVRVNCGSLASGIQPKQVYTTCFKGIVCPNVKVLYQFGMTKGWVHDDRIHYFGELSL